MSAIQKFFGPSRWTFAFWEWGPNYSIVKNRHIGLDVGSRGRVPSLLPGRVARVVKTTTMAWVVVIDTGRKAGRYHSHCHMSGHGLPREGDWVGQGQEFATVAVGPKGLPASHPDFGGTLWDGAHDHLVVHDKIGGAYLYGQNDTYYDPADVIREVLSAPAGAGAPFDLEDDMFTDEDRRMLRELRTTQLEDSGSYRATVRKQIDDMQGRLFSIHANGFRAGGTLAWLDEKLAATAAAITAAIPDAGDVDEAKLARELGPILTSIVESSISALDGLSDADVKRLAKASADEADRRERERLAS